MRFHRKFKDEFILHFEGDEFVYNDQKFLIYGTTGIDIDCNIIQIRDELMVQAVDEKKPYSFSKLLLYWDRFHPVLISIAKKKMLVHRRRP